MSQPSTPPVPVPSPVEPSAVEQAIQALLDTRNPSHDDA